MSTYHFQAHALTPIHVGSGCEIDPTEFVLHDDCLLHFSPSEVVDELPTEELERYLRLLENADLQGIQAFLRSHLDREKHTVIRVSASTAFRNEFREKASNPNNQFRVEMMPRNPHTGMAYLPGSSIKGAIRTAVVNFFTNLADTTSQQVHNAVQQTTNIQKKAEILEEKALNRRRSQTERDVFRLVKVEDCNLPDGCTRIDRAVNLNPSRRGSENIQMWVERLASRADFARPPEFSVTLHIDDTAMQHNRVKNLLGRTLSLQTIIEACNKFYWKRMQAEGDKFDARQSNGNSWQALHNLFPLGQLPDGKRVLIDPSTPYWCMPNRKRILLRVGRFCHFESLSVDKLRQGYNPQARRPIRDMGATRTRCLMENRKPHMPFGWLILTLDMSS